MRSSAIFLSFAGLAPFASGVRAYGVDWGLRMASKRFGAYDLTVRTSPKQPRTGHLHIMEGARTGASGEATPEEFWWPKQTEGAPA